jgi:hypothetical protein
LFGHVFFLDGFLAFLFFGEVAENEGSSKVAC